MCLNMNIRKYLLHIVHVCYNMALINVCALNCAYGDDTNEAFAVMSSSSWVSQVYRDANGNELIAIIHLSFPDKAEFNIQEYVRRQGEKANPDVWSLTKSIEGLVGNEITISISSSKLTLRYKQDETSWPLEYRRQSVRYVQPNHDMAEALQKRIDAIGQWMSYSVNNEMWDPLIWTLAIAEDDTFSMQMYSYGQPAAPNDWSLMLKLVGDIRYELGALDIKHVFNVPSGSLEQWHGETPLLKEKVELLFDRTDSALFVVFPADVKDNSPNMVLTFHRNGVVP